MNVEELANGFVNAFSDMAKAASEFGEACNIVTDSIKKASSFHSIGLYRKTD